MVEVGEDVVGFEVGHDVVVDNIMIKDLAGDRSEGDGSVVSWGVTVTFFKGTGDVGS